MLISINTDILFVQVFYLAAAGVCYCSAEGQLATSRPIPRVGFNATEKTQEGSATDSNNWIGFRQGGDVLTKETQYP